MKRISMFLCAVAIMLMSLCNTMVKAQGTMKDQDGNTYKTVKIGKQEWMAENMRTTHDYEGNLITLCSDTSSVTPFRHCFDNSVNVNEYGYLYNWPAAIKVCPKGWHLPTDAEWKQLELAEGMSWSDADNEGFRGHIAAKLCADKGWETSTEPNAAGNKSAPDRNTSGFSALPAGTYCCPFLDFGYGVGFWSATEYSDTNACERSLYYLHADIYRGSSYKYYGFSVRCVRD